MICSRGRSGEEEEDEGKVGDGVGHGNDGVDGEGIGTEVDERLEYSRGLSNLGLFQISLLLTTFN